jgi:hypothetical protein
MRRAMLLETRLESERQQRLMEHRLAGNGQE